jgi:hypothetical protein
MTGELVQRPPSTELRWLPVPAVGSRLARRIGNATVRTDNLGTRIYKEHKHSTRRIDLAVCAIVAHSVAATAEPGPQLYWYDRAS